MTGKSDDARTPEDERARVDTAWDELLDGADTAESSDSSASEDHSHSSGHTVVGKDRVADPEREMDRLMFGAPPALSKKGSASKAAAKGVFDPPKFGAPKKKDDASSEGDADADPKASGGESDEAKDDAEPEDSEVEAKSDAESKDSEAKDESDAESEDSEAEAAEAKDDDKSEEREAKEKGEAESEDSESKADESAKGDAKPEGSEAEAAEAKDDDKSEDSESKADESAKPDAKPEGSESNADTTSDESSKSDADQDSTDSEAESSETTSTESKRSSRPALRVVSSNESAVEKEDDEPPRASRPVETSVEPPAAANSGGPPWGWIGMGILAVGAVIAFSMGGDDGAKTPTPPPTKTASADVDRPADPRPVDPKPAEVQPEPTEPTPAGDGSTAGEPPESGTSTGGSEPRPPLGDQPRVAPPGTSPEAAAAFMRLPVSPSDRPPVGGVGAKGIHIDNIAMGSQVVGGTCKGRADGFSVSRRETASVCVRVVHQRNKEELQLLWQKHGGSTRRSKIVVQPKHAYRTRGHLKLREEYIGDWTVRILSSDDVELARHDFTVAP
ncbi:MAG: DUF2914 domain-containing protein [Myxococcota bacterium]